MSHRPATTNDQNSSQKAMIERQDGNLTDALNSLGLIRGAGNLSPEAKRHHENVALYMFIGLVAAFVFIAAIIISVELYRNGRCSKNVKLKGDKGNGRTKLENQNGEDDDEDYSEIEMNDL